MSVGLFSALLSKVLSSTLGFSHKLLSWLPKSVALFLPLSRVTEVGVSTVVGINHVALTRG